MIGIGGASMSGLALMLQQMGYQVTGSNDVEGADLAVYTTAVEENNPELEACLRRGIPVIDRPTLLGYVSELFRQCVPPWESF